MKCHVILPIIISLLLFHLSSVTVIVIIHFNILSSILLYLLSYCYYYLTYYIYHHCYLTYYKCYFTCYLLLSWLSCALAYCYYSTHYLFIFIILPITYYHHVIIFDVKRVMLSLRILQKNKYSLGYQRLSRFILFILKVQVSVKRKSE